MALGKILTMQIGWKSPMLDSLVVLASYTGILGKQLSSGVEKLNPGSGESVCKFPFRQAIAH